MNPLQPLCLPLVFPVLKKEPKHKGHEARNTKFTKKYFGDVKYIASIAGRGVLSVAVLLFRFIIFENETASGCVCFGR